MPKSLAFAPEATLGTAVTPTLSMTINPSDGLQVDMGRNEYAPLNGTRFGVQELVDGQVAMEGSIEMAVDKALFAYLLASVLGTPTTTDNNNGTFTHVFTPADSITSLTMEQFDGKLAQTYAGVIANTATFNFPIDDLPTVAFDLLALSQTTSTSHTTPTWLCETPYNHTNVKVFIDDTEAPDTADVEIGIEANNEAIYGYPKEARRYKLGRLTATGSMIYYLINANTAQTFYSKYISGTPVDIKIQLEGDFIKVDGVATETKYKVEVEIPRAILTAAKDPMDEDAERFEIEFGATVKCSNQEFVKVTVVNDVESYTAET